MSEQKVEVETNKVETEKTETKTEAEQIAALTAERDKWKSFSRKHEESLNLLKEQTAELTGSANDNAELKTKLEALTGTLSSTQHDLKVLETLSENGLSVEFKPLFKSATSDDEFKETLELVLKMSKASKPEIKTNPLQGLGGEVPSTLSPLEAAFSKALK